MSKERREFPRIERVLKVSYQDSKALADYTENFSEEGVFINTEQELAIGTPIVFEVSMPGLIQPLQLKGEVAWCRPARSVDDAQSAGVGIRLKFDQEMTRERVGQLLRQSDCQGKESGPRQSQEKCIILLAEDNSWTKDLFLHALKYRTGLDLNQLEILDVSNAEEAWKLLQNQELNLVIIEWRLCRNPDYNILQLVRSQNRPGALSVVVVGGSDEERGQALAAGADVYLRRPIPAKGLINTVCSLLGFEQKRAAKNPISDSLTPDGFAC